MTDETCRDPAILYKLAMFVPMVGIFPGAGPEFAVQLDAQRLRALISRIGELSPCQPA